MSKRKTAVVCMLILLMSLCSCSQRPVENPDISVPADTSAPEEAPVPKPSDPMDGIYPVTTQVDAAEILKQAYEAMVPN